MGDNGLSGRTQIEGNRKIFRGYKIVRINSKQMQVWASEFGVEYTDRNLMTIDEMDLMYIKRYGISRTAMNAEFLGGLDRDTKILEVGSNIGVQLEFLQRMGLKSLYGIEISPYAVEMSKSRTKGINIIEGSALDIPFKSGWFDLVFTSGLLIHISPEDLFKAMEEIYRCSSCYIWGLEYYAENLTQVKYREAKETSDLLWKGDYPKMYSAQFPTLELVKAKKFKYIDSENEDVMFLLRRSGDG